MGIVLKRRDNAPIVKYVFGHVIEKIMIDRDFDSMLQWLKETLQMIRSGEFDLSKFIITKSLRGYYKNPQQIAHKVLADRMAERDPGNKPKSNDRIPYAYIQLKDEQLYDYENPYKSGIRKGEPREKNVMQGDRIEHVDHILKKKLKLDYEFYITNQIMNPVKQVLDLHREIISTLIL
jgi:DNA polymerase elongation subunit (family B)